MGKASRKKRTFTTAATSPPPEHTGKEALHHEHLDRTDTLIASTVAILSLAVYWKTLCPSIYTSGAGENVTAVLTLGVPHPPGFPLFCLLGKLFTVVLPVGNAAFRVNLFSAACGAAAAGVMYLVARLVHGSHFRFAAISAALLFAFSRTFWSQAVIAEVYTLNALLLLLILFSLIHWESGGTLWPAGLSMGLGLAVHPLQALFLPGWLYFVFTSTKRKDLTQKEVAKTIWLLLAGVSLHLYPLIRSRANPPLDWGNPENLRNLWAYLTASQYRGRMFSLPIAKVGKNLVEFGQLMFHELSPWLLILPAVGAWILFRKSRGLFLATAISAALTLFYAINYDIPWEIDVYYIPVVLVFCLWASWALAAVSGHLRAAAVLIPLLALLPALHNYSFDDRSQHRIGLAYGHDLLRTCPQNATLVVPNTDATFALLYLTAVEKQRPDLFIWVEGEGGLKTLRDGINPDVRAKPPLQLCQENFGKPIFYSHKIPPEALPGYTQIPYGILYQVVHKQQKPELQRINFGSYELEQFVSPIPRFYLDDRSRIILAAYLLSRGDNAGAEGKTEEARNCYAEAQDLAGTQPEIASELGMRLADSGDREGAIAQLKRSLALMENAVDQNRLGRLLAQSHRYEEAQSAFERAIQLDPNFAMAHSNMGALYASRGDLPRARTELETALHLDPNNPLAHNNLARIFLLTGNRDRAIEEFRTSLTLDPTQTEIQKQLTALGITP